MTEQINHDYEVSSEEAIRHWEIPYARLEDATPTPTNPAAVLSEVPGTQVTGTLLVIDATRSVAIVDFTSSMVYLHGVRNVLTYNGGNEATWGDINIGDPVYYDRSAGMPAGTYLSKSPLDSAGVANPLFGFVVPEDETDVLPKGADGVASTNRCAVMQVGAGR
jgi:hypothetical protein